jgi:hypothetical protein
MENPGRPCRARGKKFCSGFARGSSIGRRMQPWHSDESDKARTSGAVIIASLREQVPAIPRATASAASV